MRTGVIGRPVLLYSLKTLVANEKIDAVQIDAVQIVAEESWRGWIAEWMEKEGLCSGFGKGGCFPVDREGESRDRFRGFSMPGKNRQLSILNGLRDICRYASEESFVLIHDVARPLLAHEQIRDCLETVKGHDVVMIPGDERNFKITMREDLERFRQLRI